MRLILTSRALRYIAPSWAATSLRQASRGYASAPVFQTKPSEDVKEQSIHSKVARSLKTLEDHAAQSMLGSDGNTTSHESFENVKATSEYTNWQRRILTLGRENEIVSEDGNRGIWIGDEPFQFDDHTNLSEGILQHLDRRLYLSPDHPLSITKDLVTSVFQAPTYRHVFNVDPVVTTTLNFDVLGFPADHPGRSKTDTYYVNKDNVLRTHTSAHEDEAFKTIRLAENGVVPPHEGFTIVADVFRRDSVDRSHYPVFHQMEGARTWKGVASDPKARIATLEKDLEQLGRADLEVLDVQSFTETNPMQKGRHNPEEVDLVAQHLRRSLEHLIVKIVTVARQARANSDSQAQEEPIKARWVEAYFPFTAPSYELEVWWKGEWLELLGCGVSQQNILDNAGIPDRIGWAWGIGLERLAMLLFNIHDIRLFWSKDPRFLNQFQRGKVTEFKPFSRYPPCFKDVAFWIDPKNGVAPKSISDEARDVNPGPGTAAPAGGHIAGPQNDPPLPSSDSFHENDLMEIVRDVAGTMAEDVRLVDSFKHPKTSRRSLCYRINYRSLERTLTNEETNELHQKVRDRLAKLDIELR